MKKFTLAACTLLAIGTINAQQKQGKVVYERTVQMQVNFGGANEEMQRMIPKSRTDRFELTFGDNKSVWRSAEEPNAAENSSSFSGGNSEGGGSFQFRMAGGADDVVYIDLDAKRKVEKREVFDKSYIIDDSIRPLKIKLTGETKTILNHLCSKAIATQIRQSSQMSMTNGKMERKEVTDTISVILWFTNDVPVAVGPAEYQGQVPGLILEVDANGGRQTYKAVSITEKADLAVIKEPTGKKRYTVAEFAKERQKMMEQLQQNSNGGGRRIIMTN